jgi:trehalose/maltose hydrolase-like predicted phosphorylase
VGVERSLYQMEDYIQQVLAFDVREGEPVRVEKMVAFYTSHDRAINETLGGAGKSAARYPAFAEALERHGRAWEELWEVRDLRLPGNERVQLLLRLHIRQNSMGRSSTSTACWSTRRTRRHGARRSAS